MTHSPEKWTPTDKTLDQPMHWRKPRMVTVADIFNQPFDFIDKVFAVMAMSQSSVFQMATTNPKRMHKYTTSKSVRDRIRQAIIDVSGTPLTVDDLGPMHDLKKPLHNLWLGVKITNQHTADERIPWLLKCPAAMRFVSAEPLLESVDFLRVDASGFGGPAGHKVDCIRKGFWSKQ